MRSVRFAKLPYNSLRLTDSICEDFEKEIANRGARIEEFLNSVAPSLREPLFCELLAIELEHRMSEGDFPDPREYQNRFPYNSASIQQVFAWLKVESLPAVSPETDIAATYDADTISLVGKGSASEPESDLIGQQVGDFRILDLLGAGGMGVVYKAKQASLNRIVALKMMKPGLLADREGLRRFKNEADAVALLDHSSIVPIYEVGERQGQQYFAMKFIEGGNLSDRQRQFAQDSRAAASIVAQIAEAVFHAHMRGILHRDLKPANILLDENGRPHITDFGLAKHVGHGSAVEMTQTGQIVGTPAYMSPEQALGKTQEITTATDVYGLGAILYTLLTEKPPFQGASVLDTLDAVRNQDPTPPTRSNPNIPKDLETIALKCLEKDPQRRYITAQSLAADLYAWLEGRPISARRVGALERGWLWCKRKPAVALLSLSTLLSIVAGASATITIQAINSHELALENAATKRAEQLADQRLDRAMESIKDYYSGFGKVAITGEQIPVKVRENLLAKPRQFYLDLTQELEDKVVVSDRERRLLGEGQLGLANIYYLLGRYDEALNETDLAAAQFNGLIQDQVDPLANNANLADCLNLMGDIHRATGTFDEARDRQEEAIALCEELVNAEPDIGEYRVKLANAYGDMGQLWQALGNSAQASEMHDKSVAHYESLTSRSPQDAEYLSGLASCYNNLGLSLAGQSEWNLAQDAYEKSIDLKQQLVDLFPDSAEYLDGLAASHNNLGMLLFDRGQFRAARQPAQDAVDRYVQLVSAHPGVPEYLDGMAGCYTNLGRDLQYTGELDAAVQAHREAIKGYELLVVSRPNSVEYQDALANSFINLGSVLNELGQTSEAKEAYARGIEIKRTLADAHPDVPTYQFGLAAIYSNLANIQKDEGQFEAASQAYVDAIAVVDRLYADYPKEPNYQYALSVFHVNLGILLRKYGHSSKALKEFELSQRTAIEGTPVALELPELLRKTRAEEQASERLPAILDGTIRPLDTAEMLALARLCYQRSLFPASVGFWKQAFESDPSITQDRGSSHRYAAAQAALAAAQVQGEGDAQQAQRDALEWRAHALEWLSAELTAWNEYLQQTPQEERAAVRAELVQWKTDRALSSVREPDDSIPKEEQDRWIAFWKTFAEVTVTTID